MGNTATLSNPVLSDSKEKFRRQMVSGWKFKLYLLSKMPIALVAGLSLDELNAADCKASMPFRWLSQNPFRSIYFATQSMAAELSTGALALLAVEGASPSVAMLITGLRSEFIKKANARVTFHCEEGQKVFEAVEQSIRTGEGCEVEVETVGTMPDGTIVSRFWFTWSFKPRSK